MTRRPTLRELEDRIDTLGGDMHTGGSEPTLTDEQARGLLERERPDGHTTAVWLTESGLAAGREIFRRHLDSRYSLVFETL